MNIRRNLAFNFLLSASQIIFPLVTIPYITRVLDPEGVGKVAFIDSLTYFFTVIAEFGIVTYGIREVARVQGDPAERSKVVSELLLIQFIASSIAMVLYGAAILFWFDKIGDPILVVLSACFFLANFLYCEWYFWGRERFRYITVRSMAIRLAGIVAIFLLVREQQDNRMYYGVMVGSSIAVLASNFIVMARQNDISFRELAARRHIRPLLVNFGISLTYSITTLTDVPVVRLAAGVHAAGLYVMAARMVKLSSSVLTDIFLVLYPHTVRVAMQDDKAHLYRTLPDYSDLLLAISLPASALLFLCAPDIVRILLGPSFADVTPQIEWLSPYPAIVSFSLFLNKQVLMVHDREDRVLRALLVGNLFFLPACIFMATKYSGPGACIALVTAESIILAFNFIYCRNLLPNVELVRFRSVLRTIAGIALLFPLRWAIARIGMGPVGQLGLTLALSLALLIPWTLWITRPRIGLEFATALRTRIKPRNLG